MAKKNKDYEEELDIDEEDIEEEKTTSSKKTKEIKPAVQNTCSDSFTQAIKEYLDDFASKDTNFNNCYNNPKKSIVECCAYIVGQVRKMNVYGLDNNEVYQLARHYYLEEIDAKDLQVTYQPNRVISNKHIDVVITEEEKAKAKEEALNEYKRKCEEKIKKENEKTLVLLNKQEEKKKVKIVERKQDSPSGQLSLFDF